MLRSHLALSSALLGLALAGCPSNPEPTDGGTDGGGPPTDAPTNPCNRPMVPNPEQLMGACCYRASQASQTAAPEYRIRSIGIDQPAASPLAGPIVRGLLNQALTNETWNWLVRAAGAETDGPVDLTTGFGRRNGDGTYTFDTAMYPSGTFPGTLTGEEVDSQVFRGPLAIPVFDMSGTVLQVVLNLHDIRVQDVMLSEMRSCIGTLSGVAYTPAARLDGYLLVADARTSTLNVPPVNSDLCSVIAGELATPAGMMPLCMRPQSTWIAKPDSLCGTSGCMENPAGTTSVCDPDGGANPCNAWHLEAQFAAVGVNITP